MNKKELKEINVKIFLASLVTAIIYILAALYVEGTFRHNGVLIYTGGVLINLITIAIIYIYAIFVKIYRDD